MEVAARMRAVVAVLAVWFLSGSGAVASAQAQDARPDKVPTVLFLCPHGAAKSVLASAYFQRAARERGLNVRVESAGTDPDPAVSSRVAAHLKESGLEVPVTKPRRVTEADMAAADVVVSLGCDPASMPPPRGRLLRWDDVPGPGEDFSSADAKIKELVTQLADELARQQRR